MPHSKQPQHPGEFIKSEVIPGGLSVTAAAEKLSVTRPALSNLLNGKASLSQKMASRLEKVFGADREELMALQREYDRSAEDEVASKLIVSTYAPTFLDIRAQNIEAWADRLDARAQLPALVRKLVCTTGATVSKSDFPAYDNSQKHGWDGFTECVAPNSWVPEGACGWEFGCNANPWVKATEDFNARCKLPLADRKETTFIFVTPRAWPKKDEWVANKRDEKKWRDVRAYDAGDLEQWLENSPSAQIWLANLLGIPALQCKTLEECWDAWARVSEPPMSSRIFDSQIEVNADALKQWFSEEECSPLIVKADSKEEGLAFLAAATQISPDLGSLKELAIFFGSSTAIERLKGMTSPIVPVIYSGELDQKVIETFPNSKSLIIADKNLPPSGRTIEVGLPSYESFKKAIEEMNLDEGQYASEIRGSGRSPTILRRLFAKTPSLRMPKWALDPEHKRWMVPFVLVGRWDWGNKADQDIISILSGQGADVIEHRINELSNLVDAPLLKEGRLSGVASKLESLRAIAGVVRERDISEFFQLAEYVLEEDDPSLDLEKSQRWTAAIHKKLREHSGTIRKSICDTVILLAVHGPVLLDGRLNIALTNQVTVLINKLLIDREPRVWLSQQNDLPSYAEAAPEAFLSIVEDELAKPHASFDCLFESAEGGLFSRCERTGMLWALELLAWKPDRLGRVINILASLCRYRLDDNWSNKPAGSIRDILLSWYPQTQATVEQREEVLEALCLSHPDVGWEFCLSQLGFGGSSTSGTYKPKWRDDAVERGVCTYSEKAQFQRKCMRLMLLRSDYDLEKLKSLIGLLGAIPDEYCSQIENLVMRWLDENPTQAEIAQLREHVRVNTITVRAHLRKEDDVSFYDGRKLYAALEPSDLVQRSRWLFERAWVEFSQDEIINDDINFDDRDEQLATLRESCLREILDARGVNGVIQLCHLSEAPEVIGHLLAQRVMEAEALVALLVELLLSEHHSGKRKVEQCISGALFQFRGEALPGFLDKLIRSLPDDTREEESLRVLKLAPACPETWKMVDELGQDAADCYWRSLRSHALNLDGEGLTYCVKMLLSVNRPRAAFQLSRFKLENLSSTLLHQVLFDIATKATDEAKEFNKIESYSVVSALRILNSRDEIDVQKLVQLEFVYGPLIRGVDNYDFPNLSWEVANSPGSFFQLVALCFYREDGKVDDDSLRLPSDSELRRNSAELAFEALSHLSIVPGTDKNGDIDADKLGDWVRAVRDLAREHDRLAITDQNLAELLRQSKPGEDGVWPNAAVRKVMEEVASENLAIGLRVAVRNARGTQFRPRPNNGDQERAIAAKYRGYAEAVMNQSPFVGKTLMSIADSYELDARMCDEEGRITERFSDG